MKHALEGIRVLDLSQFLSGPRCTQILAAMGAEVIKIESPAGDTMRLLMSMVGSERSMSTLHQDKLGMVIDFKKAEGRGVLRDLVARSDVLVENLAPGAMEKMGLGYEALKKENPRLVYASISGFGRTGPLSDRTAFDIIAQATGGVMYANHLEAQPPGVFFGDLVSGAYSAMGVMAALMQRERTGEGQLVDISMQDVMYYQNFWGFSERANAPVREEMESILGISISELLTSENRPMAFWNSYAAKDGYVVVVALTDRQWDALLSVIGREDLKDDPRFSNFVARIRNAEEGVEIVGGWVAEHTVEEVVKALSDERIPCGPVQDYDMLAQDPQLAAREMTVTVKHKKQGEIEVPGFPIKFSAMSTEVCAPGPDLGEHTDRILKDVLGYDEEAIERLRSSGAVM